MSKRTYIILAFCLLIIGSCVGGYFFLRKRSSSATDPSMPESPDDVPGDLDTILKRGSMGEDVKKLQRFLSARLLFSSFLYDKVLPTFNGETLSSLDIDGIFGQKTECACEWWFGRTSVKTSEIPNTL